MSEKTYRSVKMPAGFVAEYLPVGQRTWRLVKVRGVVCIFPSACAARDAAEAAYVEFLEPRLHSTIPADAARLNAKLAGEAESWLRSKREDIQNQTIIRKAGKRPLIVLPGRVRA